MRWNLEPLLTKNSFVVGNWEKWQERVKFTTVMGKNNQEDNGDICAPDSPQILYTIIIIYIIGNLYITLLWMYYQLFFILFYLNQVIEIYFSLSMIYDCYWNSYLFKILFGCFQRNQFSVLFNFIFPTKHPFINTIFVLYFLFKII